MNELSEINGVLLNFHRK